MIVLFTDFGLEGPYTGQVLAVLQQTAPGIVAIPLFADAPAGQPKPSAYLLAAYSAWFPEGTVFVCVVDPGVGGSRRAVIAEGGGKLFVGPDNGLFDIVLRRARDGKLWEIAWRPSSVSASFHGRDLFAPVAARLARGDKLAELARPIDDRAAERGWPVDLAEIVYIDHYGNALTGLRGAMVPPGARLKAGGRSVVPAATFSAVPAGDAFWYVNSNGLAEIAVNGGSAGALLGLRVGSPAAIENAPDTRRE
jgi:S-adenosyl-L-methionine hydrolase (adenosine-forming)